MSGQNSDRYMTIDGRRWRKSDPSIPDSLRSELVHELMSARRAVKDAKRADDSVAIHCARNRVQDAKVALGERGRAWWLPMERAHVRKRLACAIRALLRKRGLGKTICPSEAARICGEDSWRNLLDDSRLVAAELVELGWLEIVQHGEVAQTPLRGPIRLRQAVIDLKPT